MMWNCVWNKQRPVDETEKRQNFCGGANKPTFIGNLLVIKHVARDPMGSIMMYQPSHYNCITSGFELNVFYDFRLRFDCQSLRII